MSGAVNGRLVEMLAHQHQPDGKAVDETTGERHRRMVRDVEGAGVPDHLEGALHVELPRRVGWRKGSGLHGERWHEQQIVLVEHVVVRRGNATGEVHGLTVILAAEI